MRYRRGMTATETFENSVRVDFDGRAKTFMKAMAELDRAATKELDRVDFDVRLRELVRIRASQLNGCAYCVDMHSRDARAAGETERRIYSLPVWRETPFFSARERAALAFSEAVTLVATDHVPDEAYAAVAEHYSEDEIAALISLLVTINAWSTIGPTTRAWVPGD
jgi:AhpD family alkylhydroperoxidase